MAHDETVRDEAVAWAVRTGDPGFDDWERFTEWLEADPANAAAYDTVAVAVGDAAQALPAIPPAINDDEPAVEPRRPWLGAAVAAVLAVAATFGLVQMQRGTYAVETAAGETRLVELEGGGQLAVAGDTRVILDRRNAGVATLEHGQAVFILQHDSDRPFRVTVGEDTLVDVGTVFEVEHVENRVSVAVSEGAIVLNPGREDVRVSPGQVLSRDAGSDSWKLESIALSRVGEWREGRLSFQDATLSEVAADISRATGVSFVAASQSPDRRVSGSLLIDPVRRDPRTLGALLGVTVRHTGDAWEIGTQ